MTDLKAAHTHQARLCCSCPDSDLEGQGLCGVNQCCRLALHWGFFFVEHLLKFQTCALAICAQGLLETLLPAPSMTTSGCHQLLLHAGAAEGVCLSNLKQTRLQFAPCDQNKLS